MQLLLRQTGGAVKIISREEVTQGDPVSMVLYRIILAPLVEVLRAAYPGLLSTFFVD